MNTHHLDSFRSGCISGPPLDGVSLDGWLGEAHHFHLIGSFLCLLFAGLTTCSAYALSFSLHWRLHFFCTKIHHTLLNSCVGFAINDSIRCSATHRTTVWIYYSRAHYSIASDPHGDTIYIISYLLHTLNTPNRATTKSRKFREPRCWSID